MSEIKNVPIASQTDIVLLRMSIRDAARAAGLSLADQARISLAVSTIAEAADANGRNHGHATIEACHRDERMGTQVTYIARDGNQGRWPQLVSGVKWMVDELTVEQLPPNQVRVTVIKWKA